MVLFSSYLLSLNTWNFKPFFWGLRQKSCCRRCANQFGSNSTQRCKTWKLSLCDVVFQAWNTSQLIEYPLWLTRNIVFWEMITWLLNIQSAFLWLLCHQLGAYNLPKIEWNIANQQPLTLTQITYILIQKTSNTTYFSQTMG